MKFNTYVGIVAILSTLNGLAFLLVPETALPPYGIITDIAGILNARYFGAVALGMGVLLWFAKNTGEAQTRRAIATGILVGFIATLVVSVGGTLAGVLNALGWSLVVIDVLVVLGAGYFLFIKKEQ
jgi:hypothetical protein